MQHKEAEWWDNSMCSNDFRLVGWKPWFLVTKEFIFIHDIWLFVKYDIVVYSCRAYLMYFTIRLQGFYQVPASPCINLINLICTIAMCQQRQHGAIMFKLLRINQMSACRVGWCKHQSYARNDSNMYKVFVFISILTHWGLSKMTNILDNLSSICYNKNVRISIGIGWCIARLIREPTIGLSR